VKRFFIFAFVLFVTGCEDDRDMRRCEYEEGELSPEDHDAGMVCPEGTVGIMPAKWLYPCEDDGSFCSGGCSAIPPYSGFWEQCSPCGNGKCECDLGENDCNCPEDCR